MCEVTGQYPLTTDCTGLAITVWAVYPFYVVEYIQLEARCTASHGTSPCHLLTVALPAPCTGIFLVSCFLVSKLAKKRVQLALVSVYSVRCALFPSRGLCRHSGQLQTGFPESGQKVEWQKRGKARSVASSIGRRSFARIWQQFVDRCRSASARAVAAPCGARTQPLNLCRIRRCSQMSSERGLATHGHGARCDLFDAGETDEFLTVTRDTGEMSYTRLSASFEPARSDATWHSAASKSIVPQLSYLFFYG